jgi:eukaryotic-like serine/threonine-protein kinase
VTDATRDRWRRIERIVDAALDRPVAMRSGFLDEACGGDPAIRAEVERFLEACDDSAGFLATSAGSYLGAMLAETTTLSPTTRGARLGAYRVLEELGRGGMGSVYLAERDDGQFTQRVALKVARGAIALDDPVVKRLVEERQILASLEHPNIARLIDGGVTADGTPYFAMEYVRGRTITEYCDARALAIPARLELFTHVCAAVQYAHRSFVVHRDLKPSNILVTDEGVVKLLDFGIAKALATSAAGAPATLTARWAMTPEYASPEQMLGKPISTASDVYSLGVILYELLTGRHPFASAGDAPSVDRDPERPSTVALRDAKVASETLAERAHMRRTTPDRLRRSLRGDLDSIVLHALAADPAHRYAGPDDLAQDIHRHLDGRPVSVRRESWRYRAVKFVRRNRLAVAAGAAIAVLAVSFLVVVSLQSRRIRAESALVSAERDRAQELSAFLTSLFQNASPYGEGARALTMREVLDSGAVRVSRELADNPDARLDIMFAMARSYYGLGLYEPARRLADSAMAIAREYGEARASALAAVINFTSVLDAHAGRHREAEAQIREALAIRRRLNGPQSQAVARMLSALATSLRLQARYAEAEATLREALAIDRRYPEFPQNIGQMLRGLGHLMLETGRPREAAAAYREGLALTAAHYLDDHPETANDRVNLACALTELSAFDEAIALFEQGIAAKRRALGTEHPDLATDVAHYAMLRARRGEYDVATRMLDEAARIQRRTLPASHPWLSRTIFRMGQVALLRGDARTAERHLREALAMRRAVDGEAWNVAEIEAELGIALITFGRAPEVRELLGRSTARLRAILGDAHPKTQRAAEALKRVMTGT